MVKMGNAPAVSVIIPTAGEASRWQSLEWAITSVRAGNDIGIEVLVVLNGDRYCPNLRASLESRPDVRLIYLTEGDLTRAIARGRQAVRGRYFCFLDDDDEYLPGTLSTRLRLMDRHPLIDVLVTNGYRRQCDDSGRETETLMFSGLTDNAENPLMGLTRANWLASCGGLFRSATVGPEYFNGIQKYFEWSWLAIRLSLTRNIRFRDIPTFVVNDTPDSLSKSLAYLTRELDFLLRVLNELDTPKPFRRHLHRKLAAKHISFANAALTQGFRGKALRHYLACLGSGRAGLAYALWVRKLILK